MHKMNHLIGKQVLEIETGSPVKDWHFQRQLREWYYEELLPRMEQLFDQYGGKDQLIRLDSCSIEVRISDNDGWQEELSHALLQQLGLQLQQSEKHRLPAEGTAAVNRDAEAALLYFIEKGSLPWYATGKAIAELEETILLSGDLKTFRHELLRLLLSGEIFLKRAVLQCSDTFLKKMFPSTPGSLPDAAEAATDPPSPDMEQRLRSWKALILKAGQEADLLPLYSLPKAGRHQEPEGEQQIRRKSAETQEALKKEEAEATADPNTAYDAPYCYVDNAGLVLLHPFLQALFEHLGLYREGFMNPEAHCRAVLLTQYMVRPQRLCGEYDLMLNKILCGFPPEQTLPASIDISAEEHEEMNDLLQTVIRSWKMRGVQVNTSIDNLRTAFLHRNGKLSRSASGWHLQVEQQPWDMVLGSLPWAIGRIQASWMECLLTVDWQ